MIKTIFHPGDQWLYLKLYLNPQLANQVILTRIVPIARQLLEEKKIHQWFFIRYFDSDFHLRIRFDCRNDNWSEVYQFVREGLATDLECGVIWKLELSTYQREYLRYGKDAIVDVETVFWLDTELSCDFLEEYYCQENDSMKWIDALRRINFYMACMGKTLEQKISFVDSMWSEFENDFVLAKENRIQLDKHYRYYLGKTVSLSRDFDRNNITEALEEKFNRIPMDDSMLAGLVHMFCNRFFDQAPLKCESICYYFLKKHLKSQLARSKQLHV
ncbi:MAG: thiopeptide-type bacteriocin biosynthesis protein [Marinifilaceae bacterium]